MKKIITAMGNDVLNNELKRYAKYDVVLDDLFCQDIVIENLKKVEADTLIISGLLQGQWNLEEFIEKIRLKNTRIRIIIVTDEIDNTLRKILEDKDVLDIFLDATVEVQNIIDAIDREDPIKKKYEMVHEEVAEYNINGESHIGIEKRRNIEKKNYKNTKGIYMANASENFTDNIIIERATQKQEVIAISGIAGSGKSTIAVNLCKVLSQKSDAKILLIDLDTLNGNIDEILKVSKIPQTIEMIIDDDKKSGLNYASELIIKNRFDSNVFDELVINCGGFDVLTGNTSLYYCQNVLKEDFYEKILRAAKQKYDFIIIDTSSNIFLDSTKWALQVASKVLFVTENNCLSLKKMQQFVNIMIDIWGIWRPKIEIIVNKKYKSELEIESISQIMNDMKVVGEIKLNEESNSISYEKILSNINYIPKKNILEKLEDMRKNLFMANNKIEKEVVLNAN